MSVTTAGDLREDRRPRRRRDRADEDLAVAHVGDLVDVITTRAGPSTVPGEAAAPVSSRAALLRARPLLHALGRDAPEHDRHRVGDRLGRRRRSPAAASSRRACSSSSLRRATIGGQWLRPERRAAGRPREQQLVERLGDLVPASWKMSSLSSRKPWSREQRAELAQLVPPARQEPVVAVELVLLDVREDRAREAEQLVERLAGLLVEQRAVLLGEPVALARDLLGRAARPRSPAFSARMWPIDGGVRDARVVVPAAVEVVEPVADRHVEPRVLDPLELLEPGAAGIAPVELGVDLRRRAALDERAVDAGVDREPRQAGSSALGLKSSTSMPATICAMCWSGMSGSCALQNSLNVMYAP